MHLRILLIALIPATLLSVACVDDNALPTGPSAILAPATLAAAQEFPSLTGQWRAIGTTVLRNLETGNMLNSGNCSGSFSVTQNGDRFTGPLGTQGAGANSDRFCTASGVFTGELVARDGSEARAWLEGSSRNWPRPAVSPSCEFVAAGDGIWTGSATSDVIRLQVTDTLRCPVSVTGALLSLPMADFERTVSLNFQRR